MSILDNLNEEQKNAASKIDGPSLILAGAGSGKTRTITYKIAHMVHEKDILASEILALTFTNKAANEMKERIISLVGKNSDDITVSTFHSFAVKILRLYGDNIGFSRNFNIYDTDDSKNILRNILKEFKNKDFTPSELLSKISRLKEREITNTNIGKYIDLNYRDNKNFADIFDRYQKELIKNNCMDFSDLLLNLLKLLKIPQILEILQQRYRYILVDEYQDTNNIQYKVVKLLASKYENICVVGDEDQSIYSFRGADITNILNFKIDYPNAHITKLEQNYRSTSKILDAANSIIKNNKSSLGKKLWTDNKGGENISLFEAENPIEEAAFVAETIKKSYKNYNEVAILYRTNAQSRVLEQELNKKGIPCKIYGALSFFKRKEVKDLLSYLVILNNPNDKLNFERAITNPKRGIGQKTLEKIYSISETEQINYIEALEHVSSSHINAFKNCIKKASENVDIISINELLRNIIDETDYENYVKQLDNPDDRLANISELINIVKEYEKISDNLSLDEFLTTLSLSSSIDDMEDSGQVKLMTIHSSKGLEFENVFLVGFEIGIFPSEQSLYDKDELEEERRLCYVAITRAKKNLFISHCKSRMIYGITHNNIFASNFLNEMNKKDAYYINEQKQEIPEKKKTNIENFNPFKNIGVKDTDNFKVGKKVTHVVFGEGKITKIDEKSIYISFLSGEKKISKILADKFLK